MDQSAVISRFSGQTNLTKPIGLLLNEVFFKELLKIIVSNWTDDCFKRTFEKSTFYWRKRMLEQTYEKLSFFF